MRLLQFSLGGEIQSQATPTLHRAGRRKRGTILTASAVVGVAAVRLFSRWTMQAGDQ